MGTHHCRECGFQVRKKGYCLNYGILGSQLNTHVTRLCAWLVAPAVGICAGLGWWSLLHGAKSFDGQTTAVLALALPWVLIVIVSILSFLRALRISNRTGIDPSGSLVTCVASAPILLGMWAMVWLCKSSHGPSLQNPTTIAALSVGVGGGLSGGALGGLLLACLNHRRAVPSTEYRSACPAATGRA